MTKQLHKFSNMKLQYDHENVKYTNERYSGTIWNKHLLYNINSQVSLALKQVYTCDTGTKED